MPPLIALAAGILLSRWVKFETRDFLWTLPALVAVTLVAWRYGQRWIAYSACLISLCAAGTLIDVLHRPGNPPTLDAGSQETVLVSGCVVDPPIFNEDRDQFTVELANRAAARISLTLREGEPPPELYYGQNVEFEAKLRPIRNFQNPSSFDFAGYSARRQIYWNGSARQGTRIQVLPGRCGSRFFAAIFALRTAALHRLDALYSGDPYAIGMMEAILLGETTKLQKIWTDHFRRTGTFHALVISGMHISVLAGSLLFLMRICFVPEMPALLITAVAAWVYALVTGWSAPAIRAAGGFTLYLIGRYFFRRGRVLNLLAAVAIGYLLYDPGQMFESSFQLSFLSVLTIGAIAAPLLDATSAPLSRGLVGITEASRDPRLPPRAAQLRVELRLLAETLRYTMRIPEKTGQVMLSAAARVALYAWEMLVISTVVQIGLALPMALYFHRISFSGLSANMVIVPLLSGVIPIGFLAIFTGWTLPAALARSLLIAAEKVATWHVRWEPDWRVPDPPVWLSLAFVASLLLLTFLLRRSWRWTLPAGACVMGLFALIFVHPFPPNTQSGTLELTAIDVGQGDGLFMVFPDGKLMLVDGGGFPNFSNRKSKSKLDIGEDVISPYLWSRSIRRVDTAVATHAHDDHVGGLGALIENFHPTELWTGANSENPIWQRIRDTALKRKVRIRAMRCCDTFQYGGAQIQILSPPPDYEPPEDPKNDDSLVLRVSYGKHSFLLTGDAEKGAEARMYSDGLLQHTDVLKVGHHGSKTSSGAFFLNELRPAFALISDGFENSFHHPHPEVLARYRSIHSSILRTDQLGLITIRSDGVRLSLRTFAARDSGPALGY